MLKRPLIGIASSIEAGEHPKTLQINSLYAEAISAAGGLPIILPIFQDKTLIREAIERIHGLLLPGGVDVDPLLFHQEPLPGQGRIDPLRDAFELEAIKEIISLKKPCLGICRGCQMITVALEGTLYQDMGQRKDKENLKHSQDAPYWYPTHSILIEEGSLLEKIYGANKASVNSFHHQAIEDPGPYLYASAKATDGIIEAIEYRQETFVMGVQWHPEHLWERDDRALGLFTYFVDQSRETSRGEK